MSNSLRFLIFALTSMFCLSNVFAQNDIACESVVIVQKSDTLSIVAGRVYGDVKKCTKIVEATISKAATDRSFATIANPDMIQPGWKLCIPSPTGVSSTSASDIDAANVTNFTFFQINDVYEMTPVSGEGGVARLATLRDQLLADNPNTYTILSGNLFSPSALGTAKVDGERLAGKQMVAAMNAFGLDFATFGNHEFDLSAEQFHQRLSESKTKWFTSNVLDTDGQLFENTTKNVVLTVKDDKNREVRVGVFGLTLASNPVDYVTYIDPFAAAQTQIEELEGKVDVLVAVTHLAMPQDLQLAKKFPEIDLIIGGHEHEHALGQNNTDSAPVTKADANARTAYIIDVGYNHVSKAVSINPRLQQATSDIPDDPDVAKVVDFWLNKAFEGFREQGFDPEKRVTSVNEQLDGKEASVRNHATRLTQLIGESMLKSAPETDLSIYNGGSIRIDDTIEPGPITEYDVIRILPFGGQIKSVEMKGSLLEKTLDQGEANRGIGGYLQTANVTRSNDGWLIKGEKIDPEAHYKVAMNDFLLTGKEQNLEFLHSNSDLKETGTHEDLRKALISQLRDTYGAE